MKALIESIASVWRAPSAEIMAMRELEDAKRSLLVALTERERADAVVTFNERRVARLQETVKAIG